MKGISDSHYAVGFCVPAAELVYGLAKHDKPALYNAAQTIAGMGISAVITYGIKHGINRDRPYITYPDIVPQERYTSYSMPSGHTSFAFAAATSVSLQYPKWYVIAPAYLWAGAVGYSRLYMGVHYPSDVFIGAVVGAGSAFVAYKGQQWLLKRKTKKVKDSAIE
jgi:membrane-associated phospholipid phosphatase